MRREHVTGAVHATRAVAATDDRDELAGLLIVVGRDELDQWLLRRSANQEGDDIFAVTSPRVLAHGFATSDLNCAFGARRAH
jgi:hypothetical protein